MLENYHCSSKCVSREAVTKTESYSFLNPHEKIGGLNNSQFRSINRCRFIHPVIGFRTSVKVKLLDDQLQLS